jgi:predicted deacylase
VDFHTGSFYRTNMDQLRADLSRADVRRLARGLGAAVVVHGRGRPGTLRREATDAGIAAVSYEVGEPRRFDPVATAGGAAGVRRLMAWLGIAPREDPLPDRQQFFFRSTWVRVERGGLLFSTVQLGQTVVSGEELGTVTDPVSNERTVITAPYDGRVIGMAINQVVIPGFAAFHLGLPGGASAIARQPDVSASSEELLFDDALDDHGPPEPAEAPEDEFDERPE